MHHDRYVNMIVRLAAEIGATVAIEADRQKPGMVITFAHGRRTIFRYHQNNLNGSGSAGTARDKHFASFILREHGYRTPDEKIFFQVTHRPVKERHDPDGDRKQLAAARAFAAELGFPVVVKPNDAAQGRLFAKAFDLDDVEAAVALIIDKALDALVQRFHAGNDYRVLVHDGEVVCAYQRIPVRVTGDGVATIAELMRRREADVQERGRPIALRLDDVRIVRRLGHLGLTVDSVLPAGAAITLMDNANLSTGGEAVDLSASIHPGFARICVGAAAAIGLRLGGVDLLAPDLTAPPDDYVVLEVNQAPGTSNFTALGEPQRQVVEAMYRKILRELEAR